MRVFDLHCDTIACCEIDGRDLNENSGQLDLMRGISLSGSWIQTFACFVESSLKGEAAYQKFLSQRNVFEGFLKKYPDKISQYQSGQEPEAGKCTAILSIEGGTALGGRLDRISLCKQMGVAFFTLVWNGDNEFAHGVEGENAGLTPLGKECVKELEAQNIIVDISHLNDAGIEDVFSIAQKPVIATHSNLRSVHPHQRNLREDQFLALVKQKGLCGINYHTAFVNGGKDYQEEDLRRHVERMLELGGEEIIALGSDFDGADMPDFLRDIKGLEKLYKNMVKWFGESLTGRIFYQNARDFADRNLQINV